MLSIDEKLKVKKDAKIIVQDCYSKTYDFIDKNKDEIIKVADHLVKNGKVSGDFLYELWNVPRPLYDFEQKSLSKK